MWTTQRSSLHLASMQTWMRMNFANGLEPLFQKEFREIWASSAAAIFFPSGKNGKELLELHGGFSRCPTRPARGTEDTIVLIWSATKGIGSACLLQRLAATPRSTSNVGWGDFWPEFAQARERNDHAGAIAVAIRPDWRPLDRKSRSA